jgi:hypothetical protein
MSIEETKPISIEQVGEGKAIVEHEDGSKFECNYTGKYPERLKHDKTPPIERKYFGGFGSGTGNIKKMRERLGLDGGSSDE